MFKILCQSEDGIVNWGHCGICLGEGQVIHAWATVRIDDFRQIEQLTSPIGEHPRYIGWVPIERVLSQKSDRQMQKKFGKFQFDVDVILMKLENAEWSHIERIVDISKRAFETDIEVGGATGDYPPAYDSVIWHEQMKNEGHLLQAVIEGEIVGGAILFLDKDGETLYIGRIFIDPVHHRKGYGLSLMKMVEAYYPGIKKIELDTPLWNVRTNAFYSKLGYCEVKRDEGFAYYQKELD